MSVSSRKHFEPRKERVRGADWRVARVTPEKVLAVLAKAEEQSRLKAEHSKDEGQDGVRRTPELKFQKQLMGTLAEIAVADLLQSAVDKGGLGADWRVVRYDDVRTDGFTSAKGEYDIRLSSPGGGHVTVESRASIAHDRSLAGGLESLDIIGPYESDIKRNERLQDFYARPLYAYLDYKGRRSKLSIDLSFRELLLAGRIELYLVAGCDRRTMVERGYVKSMGQRRTRYQVVRITDGQDVNDFVLSVLGALRGREAGARQTGATE